MPRPHDVAEFSVLQLIADSDGHTIDMGGPRDL